LADENRFGTKMLEKMGWTKGNGLGAKQDGEKDFVRIRFKNDAEGLGFEARDDQWTTHEEGFNGLLKSLNGEENEANGKESEPEEEARPMGFGFKAVHHGQQQAFVGQRIRRLPEVPRCGSLSPSAFQIPIDHQSALRLHSLVVGHARHRMRFLGITTKEPQTNSVSVRRLTLHWENLMLRLYAGYIC